MGTRANIVFEGSKVVLFRHWDGYPEAVYTNLATWVNNFFIERGNEPDMLAAFIVGEFRKTHGTDVKGYRLDTKMSSDVEYVYRVTKDGTVEVRETTNQFYDRPILKNTKLVG